MGTEPLKESTIAMKIHTVHFDGLAGFRLLRDVMLKTFREVMPEVETICHEPGMGEQFGRREFGLAANTHKLAVWNDIVQSADEDLILCDCDLMAMESILDAFDTPFDIGYTIRSGPIPLNGGVVFVRNTPAAKTFFREWLKINDMMFQSPAIHEPWRAKYAGINQAAFGYLLEKRPFPVRMTALPAIYNGCDGEWGNLQNCRIWHIKSELRRYCIGRDLRRPPKKLLPIVETFRKHANECRLTKH